MEFVISESRRKRDWYFQDGVYHCFSGDTLNAKINAHELTDPEELRARRMMVRRQIPLNQRGLYRVDPDPVTVALWNDWQKRKCMGETTGDNPQA